ncbi:MAG: hypothetical protein ACI9WU_000381 [Myxococcota bacterium]|jgi:hypothetical protein
MICALVTLSLLSTPAASAPPKPYAVPADWAPAVTGWLETNGGGNVIAGSFVTTGGSVLVERTSGKDETCRISYHKVELVKETLQGTPPMTDSAVMGSDCCELTRAQCPRSSTDWLVHYARVRAAKDRKALPALAGGAIEVRTTKGEGKRAKTKTSKVSKGALAWANVKGLPALDLLRIQWSCGAKMDGELPCEVRAGARRIQFVFGRIGKTQWGLKRIHTTAP